MARPFLADPFLVQKAKEGREEEINTCIACNQACLDHTFAKRRASCLVNPRAGYEAELNYTPISCAPLRVAVVGAGPAGLACSTVAARRGHAVTLFDGGDAIGGQFNLAKQVPGARGRSYEMLRYYCLPLTPLTTTTHQVPGKEEFHETLRYFKSELRLSGVTVQAKRTITLTTDPSPNPNPNSKPHPNLNQVKLGTRVGATDLQGFDRVVLATGVSPRTLKVEGAEHAKVVSYYDVLTR